MTMELIDTVKSGNAWKVRLLCGYLGIPLKRTTLSIVDGDLDRPDFGQINPLRQVPVLRTPEGVWLAESLAILWYLGEGTTYLPDSRLQRAQVASWLSFEQTQHMHPLAQPRLLVHLRQTAGVDDAAMVAWRELGNKALAVMEAHLQGHPFLVGDAPSIADVALYPYTAMAAEGGYHLDNYSGIRDWLARMTLLPGYVPLEPDPAVLD